IWKVAVPRPQHSAMFGQRASSQIVCRLAPWISFLTSKYAESALGARTFIHSGRRGRSATGSDVSTSLSLRSFGSRPLHHERHHGRILCPEAVRHPLRPARLLAGAKRRRLASDRRVALPLDAGDDGVVGPGCSWIVAPGSKRSSATKTSFSRISTFPSTPTQPSKG